MTTAKRRVAVAFALGGLTFLAFAPYRLYVLMPALLVGLVYLGAGVNTWRQAAATGYAFGLGQFALGVSWVYISMHDFGGMPVPAAAFATAVFCAYLALFPAAACAVLGHQRWSLSVRVAIFFPALWAFGEWLRGWFFTGFPWLAAGYSQVPDGPLGHYAPLLGIYGVSWITALGGALIALIILTRRAKPIAATTALVVLLLGGFALGHVRWTQPLGEPLPVALLQGNIAQSIKWRAEVARETLDIYLGMVRASKARLIVLPETAIPMFNTDVPPEYFQLLAEHARAQKGDLLLGVPEYISPEEYYNSVMSLGSTPVQMYRKYHLVPFGDYFPRWPVLSWIMNALEIPMSNFSRGATQQYPIAAAGQKIAVNICYEDVFGEEIRWQLPTATLLANFTNDAWWGDSKASDQHLQISQMRARESGRYMLRATNTGVTAIIDERGDIRGASAQFVRTTLQGQAQGFSGATPFVRWGNGLFLLLVLCSIVAGLLLQRYWQQ